MRPTLLCWASALVAALACLSAAYDNGAGGSPPRGWNTWCTYDLCGLIDKCSDAEVRQQALAIVDSGLKDLGYEYVNMDDCWNDKTRDENGNLRPNPNRFPFGMKALVDYVHSLGLKVGLYTCIGTHTCKNGLPGSFGHYEQDAATFAEWGVDFVKCDNCNRPHGYSEQELYTNFSNALNRTNHTFFFSLCEWGDSNVQDWGWKVGQMYRIQMDHLPLYNFPKPFGNAAGSGFGQGTKNIIDYVATIKPSTFVRRYGWMDPDFLMTDFWPTMTYQYSKVEVTLWSAWSAPMIVATQLSNMTQSKKDLLANPEVLAIQGDESYTAADMVKNVSSAVQLWARPLKNGDAAIVILNQNDYLWNEPSANVTVTWADFGITADVTAVRDLWARRFLNATEYTVAGYATIVEASDVRYFRLTCAGGSCL
jgi:alpha-galactosidase